VPAGTCGPLRELHTQEEPHSSIQVEPHTRPSLRDGRTAYAVLSREPNFLWPPSRLRKSPGAAPVGAAPASTRLDRGERRPGPHGFAVRAARLPSRSVRRRCARCRHPVRETNLSAPFVRARLRAHGISRPARACRARRCRVHRIPGSRSWRLTPPLRN